MIISRTPFRISFFGGGTDYEPWYRQHGGEVLSTTINRYCYLSTRFLPPFFDYQNRIVWSQIETVNKYDEIVHPVVREALKLFQLQGVEIHHNGDLPSRAGLGSSSSFTVGILNSLNALTGKMESKEMLAQKAIYLERELLQENVGIQDQIAATYGGFNHICINTDGTFQVKPITISRGRLKELESCLVLVYTGTNRFASDVAAKKIKAIPNKTSELMRMQDMVQESIRILSGKTNISEFGYLLDESWGLKRGLAPGVAPAVIDEIYLRAKYAGALGGKLLGAGGGGFMLFFVMPENRLKVLNELEHLLAVPFEFEAKGSHIIFYEPDNYSQYSKGRNDFLRFNHSN